MKVRKPIKENCGGRKSRKEKPQGTFVSKGERKKKKKKIEIEGKELDWVGGGYWGVSHLFKAM